MTHHPHVVATAIVFLPHLATRDDRWDERWRGRAETWTTTAKAEAADEKWSPSPHAMAVSSPYIGNRFFRMLLRIDQNTNSPYIV
jgi:hypothetical protein